MLIEKDSNRGFRFVLTLILSLVVTITVAFNSGFLNFLDSTIASVIQGQSSGFKDAFYTGISFIASPKMDFVWVFVIAFFMWGFKYKLPALWALCTLVGGDIIGTVIKHLMQRPRPVMHLAADSGYSYPSGHVLGSMLVLGIIWVLLIPFLKQHRTRVILRTVMVILMILIMFSRVYLNAHFPTDTIGALLIGYSWLQIAEWLYLKLTPRVLKWRILKNAKY